MVQNHDHKAYRDAKAQMERAQLNQPEKAG
jgi:hypothetical protein